MSRVSLIRQDDFTGGLNLRADQFQLAGNESPYMLNVEIDPRGGVFSRGAMRRINTSPVTLSNWAPERLFPFYGAENYLMLSTGRTGVTPGSVFFSTGGEFQDTGIPVSSENGASFAPWGDKLYVACGTTVAPRRWNSVPDPNTVTVLTANGPAWQNDYQVPVGGYMPAADHAVTHAGKVFVAGTRENGVDFPNRIRWSHPNNPENWAELDRIDINDGGSKITGITVVAGHLVVFKENGVYAVFGYDSDTFQVVEVSRAVGCANSHSFVATENGVYFFSYPEGLMYYNGDTLSDVFEPLRPMFDLGYLNQNAIDEIYVNYVNRRIWLSMPFDEQNTFEYPSTVFVYDPTIGRRGSWTRFATADGYGASGGCTFVDDNGNNVHVVAHPGQPYVLRVDQYNQTQDNIIGTNSPFRSVYRTRWLDAGNYSQKKMFRRPDIVAKQTSADTQMRVRVFRDYEEASGGEVRNYLLDLPTATSGMTWGVSYWGSGIWGAPNRGSQIITGRNAGLARAVQIEFEGPLAREWGINSFTLKYSPRRVTA